MAIKGNTEVILTVHTTSLDELYLSIQKGEIPKTDKILILVGDFDNFSNISSNTINNKVSLIRGDIKLTLGDVFKYYSDSKKLKPNTIKTYEHSIRSIFKLLNPDSELRWNDFLICNITEEMVNKIHVSSNGVFHYIKQVYFMFNYLQKSHKIITNPFSVIRNQVKPRKTIARPSLSCEDWLEIKEVKKNLINFFELVKQESNKIPYSWGYKILVIHFILGTRISETVLFIQLVIQNKNNENDFSMRYLTLSTKKTKLDEKPDFRVAYSKFISDVINEYEADFKGCTKSYCYTKLRKLCSKFNKFCLHGTRSIFRTSIDFLVGDRFSRDVKESYIDHTIEGQVQHIYHRNDFLLLRYQLMCIYADFIFDCASLQEERITLRECIKNFLATYPDQNLLLEWDFENLKFKK